MKRVYFFYLAALCVFFSCKKDKKDDPGSYHITCKVDGTAKTFNSTAFAVKGTDDAKILAVNGGSAMSETSDGFGLVITDTQKDITAGTYDQTANGYVLLGAYHDGSANIDYESGSELSADAAANSKNIASHFKVVITAVDNKTVRGTFSGDFYPDGNLNGAKKSLTEGSFYVPIITP